MDQNSALELIDFELDYWLTIDFLTGLARFWWPRAHVGFDFWVTYYLIHSLKRFNNMDLIRCNLGFGLLVWVLGFIGLIQFQFQTHKLELAQVRYFLFSTTATISVSIKIPQKDCLFSIWKWNSSELEILPNGMLTTGELSLCFPECFFTFGLQSTIIQGKKLV